MFLAIILWSVTGTLAYIPDGKENFLFLRELVDRMGKELPDLAYVDFPEPRLPLGVRSMNRDEETLFPLDYDTMGEPLHPSIRDREFLEHSSLYGSQFVSGGAGEGKQRLRPQGSFKNIQEVKTDSTLPAYCNPPNPCPVGYTAEQGCIEDFENTASFSRRYQGSQDCMCDTEHMFECPNPDSNTDVDETIDGLNEWEFNRFLERAMKVSPPHKNLVAKKFHNDEGQSLRLNPFLSGERLPVAAKKGTNVFF